MSFFLAVKHSSDLGKFPYPVVVDRRRVQPCNATGSAHTASDHPKTNLLLPLPSCLTPFLSGG